MCSVFEYYDPWKNRKSGAVIQLLDGLDCRNILQILNIVGKVS